MNNLKEMREGECSSCGNHTTVYATTGICAICAQATTPTPNLNWAPETTTPIDPQSPNSFPAPQPYQAPEGPSDKKKPENQKVYSFDVPVLASKMQHVIARTILTFARTLLEKNRKYGNSALNPLRVHSKANAVEQIKVRADDKLSRLQSAQADDAEDALFDYIGYMILLYIAQHYEEEEIDS